MELLVSHTLVAVEHGALVRCLSPSLQKVETRNEQETCSPMEICSERRTKKEKTAFARPKGDMTRQLLRLKLFEILRIRASDRLP